jgi:cobalamin biosynthesis protein CobT
MTTTDTPRTDAERNKAFCNLRTDYEAYVYMANHAEELERELTEQTNEFARLRELLEKVLYELEKVPFQTPKLTAFTAHRLADRYREQLNQLTK